MSQTNPSLAPSWTEVAGLPVDQRDALMAGHLAALAAQTPDERSSAIGALVTAESSLEAAALADLIAARLRGLAVLETSEAALLMSELERAEEALPVDASMRLVVGLQAACKSLSLDEVSQVEVFFPNVRVLAGLPPRTETSVPGGQEVQLAAAPAKKWSLWRLFGRA